MCSYRYTTLHGDPGRVSLFSGAELVSFLSALAMDVHGGLGVSCSSLLSVIEPLQCRPLSAFYVGSVSVILDLVYRLNRGPASRSPLRYGLTLLTVKPVSPR